MGRGIGSGKGKTCGRGHKGQKARAGGKPKLGFEGGQTPLRQRIPKRGFKNIFAREYQLVNLSKLQEWIERGKIDPDQVINMKVLRDTGCVSKKILDGVKVLSDGADSFSFKVNLEVSDISKKAKVAIQKAGGEVTKVYYNKLGMRALMKPHALLKKEHFIPRPAQPPPYLRDRFDRLGEIPGAGELSTIYYRRIEKQE